MRRPLPLRRPLGAIRRPEHGPAIRELPSPNHDARPEGLPIDMLILHYTGMQSGQAAVARLCDPAARVSSHYVVMEDGEVLRLVPEGRRAWHAGVSAWRGQEGLNGRSIGIEIVNPGHEWGYRPFPALQIAALADLCLEILERHPIPARNVIAHSDVAPDRKQDPGELFDWQGLAGLGIGLWPEAPLPVAAAEGAEALAGLAAIGYPIDPARPELALAAFQRHWRQARVDGLADAETCGLIAAVRRLAEA